MKYFKPCDSCHSHKYTHAILQPSPPKGPYQCNGDWLKLSGSTKYLCCSCYGLLDHDGNNSHTHECCRKAKAIRDALDAIAKSQERNYLMAVNLLINRSKNTNRSTNV